MPKGASEPSDLAIVGDFAGVFRVGMFGRVAITAWIGQLDEASAEVYVRTIQESVVARLAGGRGSMIHLMNERVAMPTAGARPFLGKVAGDTSWVACTSVVVDGTGFWASAVRGVLTGMRLLASGLRIHEHASIADVVAWLPAAHEKLTGEVLDPEMLARCLELAKSWQSEAPR